MHRESVETLQVGLDVEELKNKASWCLCRNVGKLGLRGSGVNGLSAWRLRTGVLVQSDL